MTTIILLLIIFMIARSELSSYIKKFKAGYKGESDQSFWMMSYDFKPYKKVDYKPDSLEIRKRREFKNKLIIILYIIVIILFILMNSFLSHILILISN
jgi:hypothetical protein